MNEMKNAKEFICIKVDQMERTISDLEDRNKEIIQLKEERDLRLFKSGESL